MYICTGISENKTRLRLSRNCVPANCNNSVLGIAKNHASQLYLYLFAKVSIKQEISGVYTHMSPTKQNVPSGHVWTAKAQIRLH